MFGIIYLTENIFNKKFTLDPILRIKDLRIQII